MGGSWLEAEDFAFLAGCQELQALIVEVEFVFFTFTFCFSSWINLVCSIFMSVLDKEPCSKVLANKCLSERVFIASGCSKRTIEDLIRKINTILNIFSSDLPTQWNNIDCEDKEQLIWRESNFITHHICLFYIASTQNALPEAVSIGNYSVVLLDREVQGNMINAYLFMCTRCLKCPC